MKNQAPSHAVRRQGGTALVVALILLMVLTMLGVQGMRANVMQERMAGNMRERNLAFQAAEAALREGEENGQFPSGNVALADPAEWDGAGADGTLEDLDESLFADPAYHVGPPQYVRVGITVPPEFRYLYPVTAYGVGGQESSVVIVQSSFEPVN